jgi:hypothetical protein
MMRIGGVINSNGESFKVVFLIIKQPLSCILYFIQQVSCLMPTLMTIEQISKLLSSRGKQLEKTAAAENKKASIIEAFKGF